MLTMQNNQPLTNDSNQQNSGDTSAIVQAAATPMVDPTTETSTASDSATAPEAQIRQTVAEPANPWLDRLPVAQSSIQMVVLVLALLLAALAVWLLRKQKRTGDTTLHMVSAERDAKPVWHKERETLIDGNAPAPQSRTALPDGHASDSDDEDTSKPLPTHDPDFDNEATFIYQPKAEPQPMGRLIRVTSEPRFPAELPLLGSSVASSDERTIAIGRHSKHNAVVISDKSVSRKHAEIVQRDEQLFVRDSASTAGTLLNWKRLLADEELPLQHMDILSFGEAVYEFQVEKEETDGLLPLILISTNEDTELIER